MKRNLRLWLSLAVDLILILAIVGGFFAQKLSYRPAAPVAGAAPMKAAVFGEAPAATPEPKAEKTPEELFSAEPVLTESSYISPDVRIELITHQETDEKGKTTLTWYEADIYLRDLSCFRTVDAADNGQRGVSREYPDAMYARSGAVLAMSGDFASYNNVGLTVRNGVTYRNTRLDADICVLWQDGTLECIAPSELDADAVLEADPLHVWTFGPTLLEDGEKSERIQSRVGWAKKEPRAAIGYYEPGHYCFVVADGRQAGYSEGADLDKMAGLLQSLGCVNAYNLDGGGSAFMAFAGERVNRQSSNRAIGDLLCIIDSHYAPTEEETK